MSHRLTVLFSRFLHRRQRRRHFDRHPLQDLMAGRGDRAAAPEALAQALGDVAADAPADALRRLKSRPGGLNPHEAASRLAHHGANVVEHEAPLPWWRHLWQCYKDPFNLLLSVLAAVSAATDDLRATAVIGSMVLLSTGVRFVQEQRSSRAAEALKALVGNTATVLREGTAHELPIGRLVPGDVVQLSAGDMIPADCRVLAARDLFVAQAALTGESLPQEKAASHRDASAPATPLEWDDLVFMGTNVVSGTATALVVHTGERTLLGALAARATAVETTPDAFQAGINSVSWLLIRFAAVMVPVVLLINGFTKGDWLEAALFALSVAVGLTPEMLPMIVTSTLAKGAVRLSRRQVVVKRLDAIHNLGAMDVLCTDKTGTLTEDHIALARHVDPWGQDSDEVLTCAFLNSHYQTGLKSLLDHAVIERVPPAVEQRLLQAHAKVDEVPFDFERRRMSVIVADPDGRHVLICKGALEEVLAACSSVRSGPPSDDGLPAAAQPLDAASLERVRTAAAALADDGLRVVAVATRTLPPGQSTCSVADEVGLVLVGYVAFLDPPKASAAPALRALAGHGIAVKVLTGDSDRVAAHVCAQVGVEPGRIVLGAEIAAMGEPELARAVQAHQVFAKLAPLHKERIVRALRAQGHVVGFLGDGINDAAALRAADVGISVDTAVDIAKEAADIILLEKSLTVLDDGVVEGRATFCNMLKYIRMTASSNFGNVLSVLVACAFLPFLPMLPLQLLVQNLLYDFSQTALPFDHVDAELVARPLRWQPHDIGRFMLCFGPISSLFDLATFALMWWGFGADTPARASLFQSGWFVVGLLTQTLVVHLIRTPRLPLVHSRASAPVTLTTLGVVALGLWLPWGPLAPALRLQPLPPAFYAWLVALLAGYVLLASLMKRAYIGRFGWQ